MADLQLPQRWTPPRLAQAAPAGHGPPPVDAESALKSVVQLIALTGRHWLLVLAITITFVGILIYRVWNEPRMYRAVATFRLEDKAREISNGMSRSPVTQTYRPFNDPVLSQLQVLESQAVAESVAVSEGLRIRQLPSFLPPKW